MSSAGQGLPDAEETVRAVGARIRQARKQRRLTLQELADRTGVSISMLSMLERGMVSPSIGTLVAVASALGLHMANLFNDPSAGAPSPVRRVSDQLVVQDAEGVLRRLVHTDLDHGLELVVNEYEPGTSSSSVPIHHEGVELGVVVQGTLTISLGGVDHVLHAGDGITYPSRTPHRITNTGRSHAKAVWVNLDA